MIKLLEKYQYLVLTLVIFSAALVGLHIILRTGHSNKELKSLLKVQQDSIKITRNKLNQAIAEKQAAIASIDNIRIAFKSDLEAIRKEFKIRNNNLKAFIKSNVITQYNGSIRVDTITLHNYVNNTTTPLFVVKDSNKWMDIEATIGNGKFDYHITTRDSITYAIGYKREKWWKAKKLIVNGKNENPNSHIYGLTGVVIDDYKPKRLGIGPSVQIGLDGIPRVGVSVQYSLIRF